MLEGVGTDFSYYYLYRNGRGYTVSDEDLSVVSAYLDDKLNEYEHPAATEAPYDVVAEWSATNEYINNMARQTNEPV